MVRLKSVGLVYVILAMAISKRVAEAGPGALKGGAIRRMEAMLIPEGYPGRILRGAYSPALRDHVRRSICRL